MRQVVTLPWISDRLHVADKISDHIVRVLPPLGKILSSAPSRIEIMVSERCTNPEQKSAEVEGLLIETLRSHIPSVLAQHRRLCEDSRIPSEILRGVPTPIPWYIVELPEGGLGVEGMVSGNSWMMVPCRLYISHAVYWDKGAAIGSEVGIITARLPGKAWDPENDFLHEYLHAAIAPIPMYVQAWHIQLNVQAQLLELESTNDLTEDHVGWITYAIPEIVVAYLANEKRDTETGFPVLETTKMLENFLRLTSTILPRFGFAETWNLYQNNGLTEKTRLSLVASCMRALEIYGDILSTRTPPLEYFRILAHRSS